MAVAPDVVPCARPSDDRRLSSRERPPGHDHDALPTVAGDAAWRPGPRPKRACRPSWSRTTVRSRLALHGPQPASIGTQRQRGTWTSPLPTSSTRQPSPRPCRLPDAINLTRNVSTVTCRRSDPPLACATIRLPASRPDTERADAALPFLSTGAAVLATAELVKATMNSFPLNPNFACLDFHGPMFDLLLVQRKSLPGGLSLAVSAWSGSDSTKRHSGPGTAEAWPVLLSKARLSFSFGELPVCVPLAQWDEQGVHELVQDGGVV